MPQNTLADSGANARNLVECVAPPSWRSIDFISDLHLHAQDADTFAAWQAYMATTPADAVFILGDWFDAWVGDDTAVGQTALQDSIEAQAAHTVRNAAQRLKVHVMHGNRDFLIGSAFLQQCHAHAIADPCVLIAFGKRWLLTHGDGLCTDDHAYMAFKAQVRSAAWQSTFLAQPLGARRDQARAMRAASQAAHPIGSSWIDVNGAGAAGLTVAAHADALIHGHTHEGQTHGQSGTPAPRWVTLDWDANARPPRLQVLRLNASGLARVPLSF